MHQNFFKNFFAPDLGDLSSPNGMTGRKKKIIYIKFRMNVLFVNTIFSSSPGPEYSSVALSRHAQHLGEQLAHILLKSRIINYKCEVNLLWPWAGRNYTAGLQ